jgi:hypothetical protein
MGELQFCEHQSGVIRSTQGVALVCATGHVPVYVFDAETKCRFRNVRQFHSPALSPKTWARHGSLPHMPARVFAAPREAQAHYFSATAAARNTVIH